MIRLSAYLGGLCALTLASAAQAQDAELTVTTGVDYSSGDYGTGVDTNILVVPAAARLKTGNLRLIASVPYIRIDGAENIVGGEGGPIVVDPDSPRVTREGIGDVTLGANYAIPEERLGLAVDFRGRVKLPTAQSGLGTGKADVSLAAELSKSFGNFLPFVSGGYRILGDPEGVDLNNALFGSVGGSVIVGKSVVMLSYDYREATSAASVDGQEVFGAFSTPVSQTLTLTFYGSAGLSDGTADYGLGAMISLRAF